MKNFLIGVITGFLVAGLTVVILIFAAVRIAASFGEKKPVVADGSTLLLKLEGSLPEKAPTEIPIPFFEDQAPMTVEQVWEILKKAAVDSRVKAVLLEPRDLQVGWARLEELHADLEQFRKSGKPLVAFLRNPGTHEYYLATAADRIYMTPEDSLDLKGMRIEAMYLKDTLDKVGVKADVIHAGKYKDAGDILTMDHMTPETREVLNQVLDQYFGDLVTTIGTARKKQPDEVRAIIDKGPFTADQARSNGLVDTLAFDDQVSGELTKRLGQSELKLLPDKTYAKIPADSVGAAGGKRIALVVGEGDITRSTSSNGPTSDEGIASAAFLKLLRDVENDSSIKGAILRIDSPGGDGIASDDILHEARNLSKKKPVVISMGDLAASGGYFISMTGDPIVAYPNTLTGSIGVIFAKMNVHGLYDKLGIHEDILNRGRYAGLYSAYEPMNDDERQKIQNEVEDFYGQFKNRVVEGRKLPAGRVEELAQGRVWLGVQAKQNGLVDQLGGLDKAIELVKQKAQIPASEKITLVPFPPKRTIFEMLVNRTDENAVLDSKIREILGGLPVKTWLRGGFLKIMPYTITVR